MELSSSFCGCVRRDLRTSSWHSISEKTVIPATKGGGSGRSRMPQKILAIGGGPKGWSFKGSSSSKLRTAASEAFGTRRGRKLDDHDGAAIGRVAGSAKGSSRSSAGSFPFNISLGLFHPDLSVKLLTALRTDHGLPKSRLGNYVAAVLEVWTSKDLPSAVCAAAESVITLMEPAERPFAADPAVHLADNFAPVPEFPPSGFCLEVEGRIPAALSGVYIRNGSNPQFMPTGGYHQFDGDGMLHAVRVRDGRASYCCRYVHTHRFLEESKAGKVLMPKALGELYGMTGMARLGLLSLRKALGVISEGRDGIGCANAGLAFHDGRLLAMSEDDMPYAVRVLDNGDMETLGRLDFDGKLSHAMTAHPKVDPVTGELFGYGYNVLRQPYLKYFRVSPTGEMSVTVPIDRKEPTLVHDFAVTGKYAVFPEPQMVFRMDRMIYSQESPIVIDEFMVPQIGVLPKYDEDASRMKWFDMPESCNCFHFVNAWDEGEEVVLVGSCMTPLTRVFSAPATVHAVPTEFRLNLETGHVSKKKLTTESCDIGGINPLYAGRKNRYVYLSTAGPWPKLAGIVKIDLEADDGENRIVARRDYPSGCYGSEPLFVPRSRDPDLTEDDGYLVTYIHDENTGISSFLVLDARSPSFAVIASVKLPGRVPYGFHGIFLDEQQLSRQNPTALSTESSS